MSRSFRLGTRGSQLALYQAHTVAALIERAGGPAAEIVVVKTSGDRLQEAPLSELGGKRLFVKELEDALLGDEIDMAVHSSKDMPAVLPEGLAIAGVLPRADPRDAVVLPLPAHAPADGRQMDVTALLAQLGPSPSIGTSSVRRIAQLTRLLPRARFVPIRGNLDTRLRKVDAGDYDALVLAAAGLIRLGFERRISLPLPLDVSVPAPGQGIIAVEIRAGDRRTREVVSRVTDPAAEHALTAERMLVETLGGGCQTPIGAIARQTSSDSLHLLGVVVSLNGQVEARADASGPIADASALGSRVAHTLLEQGAGAILASVQQHQANGA